MIVVVGASHRTAPIAVRERLSIGKTEIEPILRGLIDQAPVGEALVLSTCNRVEIVAAAREASADLDEVAQACLTVFTRRVPNAADHLYVHTAAKAVRHLFRVAGSLDSMVLGEPQILGQLKDAFERARRAETLGSALHRAVSRAIRAAKRVRTETAIGAGFTSVPSVAVDLTYQIFGKLTGRSVLLVGSGEMAETVAKKLRTAGARLLVLGRNSARVEELARAFSGEARRFDQLQSSLVEADIVVTSTSAPHCVVTYDAVASARRQRRGRSLFFVDLAVPRDVDQRVEELDGVFLYNVDDFSKLVLDSLASRRREAERAEAIITEEAQGYDRWTEAEQVTPTIKALRARFRGALYSELSRSTRGALKHLSAEEEQAVLRLFEAAINKVMHAPTTYLRREAVEKGFDNPDLEQTLRALNELFQLETAPAEHFESHAEGLNLGMRSSSPDVPSEPEMAADEVNGRPALSGTSFSVTPSDEEGRSTATGTNGR